MRPGIDIVYDGQCPFCSAYVRMTRLRQAAGPVRLVDARSGDPLAARLRAQGVDLDRGMVVIHDGQLHHGAGAMAALTALSAPRGLMGWPTRLVFGRPWLGRRIYPVLAAGRRLTLRLLGRKPIGG